MRSYNLIFPIWNYLGVGRTLLSAVSVAFPFEVVLVGLAQLLFRSSNEVNGGGQECPPYTYDRSSASAIPIPPLTQRVARPRLDLRFNIS